MLLILCFSGRLTYFLGSFSSSYISWCSSGSWQPQITPSTSVSRVQGLSRTHTVIYLRSLCFLPTAGKKAALSFDTFSLVIRMRQAQDGELIVGPCAPFLFSCLLTYPRGWSCKSEKRGILSIHTHTHTHSRGELGRSPLLSTPASRLQHFRRVHIAPAPFFWLVGGLNETQPSLQTSNHVSSIANSPSSLSSLRLHSNLTGAALHDNQA